jgi:hypothetical protein
MVPPEPGVAVMVYVAAIQAVLPFHACPGGQSFTITHDVSEAVPEVQVK